VIEEKTQDIGTDENRSRFDGVGGRAPYGDDRKDREKNEAAANRNHIPGRIPRSLWASSGMANKTK